MQRASERNIDINLCTNKQLPFHHPNIVITLEFIEYFCFRVRCETYLSAPWVQRVTNLLDSTFHILLLKITRML